MKRPEVAEPKVSHSLQGVGSNLDRQVKLGVSLEEEKCATNLSNKVGNVDRETLSEPKSNSKRKSSLRLRFQCLRRQLCKALVNSISSNRQDESPLHSPKRKVCDLSSGSTSIGTGSGTKKQMIVSDLCLYLSSLRSSNSESHHHASRQKFRDASGQLGTISAGSKSDSGRQRINPLELALGLGYQNSEPNWNGSAPEQVQNIKFETVGQAMRDHELKMQKRARDASRLAQLSQLEADKQLPLTATSKMSHKTSKQLKLPPQLNNRGSNQQCQAQQQQQQQPQQGNSNKLLELLNQFAIKNKSLLSSSEPECLHLEQTWTEFVQLPDANEQHKESFAGNDTSATDEVNANQQPEILALRSQQDAIWELLSTEQFYLGRLRVVIDLFLAALSHLKLHCYLTEIEAERLVSNIEEIYEANLALWVTHLLPMLEHSRATKLPLDPSMLQDAFVQRLEDIFSPYYRYCLEHSDCLGYLREQNQRNANFRLYIDWCESQKGCDRLQLMDLLAKPTQRITRYSLLLRAIAKRSQDANQQLTLEQMISHMGRFVLTVDLELSWRDEHELLLSTSERISSHDLGLAEVYSDEIERLVRRHHAPFDLTSPILQCKLDCQRRLFFDSSQFTPSRLIGFAKPAAHTNQSDSQRPTSSNQSPAKSSSIHAGRRILGQLKFRDAQLSNKLDVVILVFTDQLLICKPVTSSAAPSTRFHLDLGGSKWNISNLAANKSQQSTELTGSQTTISQASISLSGSRTAICCNSSGPTSNCLHLQPSSHRSQHHQQQLLQRQANSERRRTASGSQTRPDLLECRCDANGSGSRALSLVLHPNSDLADQDATLKDNSRLFEDPPSKVNLEESSFCANLRGSVISLQAQEGRPCLKTRNGCQCHCKSTGVLSPTESQVPQTETQILRQPTKSGSPKGSSLPQLKLIRSPYPIERLEMFELEDGRSVFCCVLNDSLTIANSFILYASSSAPSSSSSGHSSNQQYYNQHQQQSSLQYQQNLSLSQTNEADGDWLQRRFDERHLSAQQTNTEMHWHWMDAIRGRRSAQNSRRRSLTPARQLINIIREAQIHMKLVADFHLAPMAPHLPPLHHLHPHQQQDGRHDAASKLNCSDERDERSTNKENIAGVKRWSLAGWSSFRHSLRNIGRIRRGDNVLDVLSQAEVTGSLDWHGTQNSSGEQGSSNERPDMAIGDERQPHSRTNLGYSPVLRSLMYHYRSMLCHHNKLDKLLMSDEQCATDLEHLYSMWLRRRIRSQGAQLGTSFKPKPQSTIAKTYSRHDQCLKVDTIPAAGPSERRSSALIINKTMSDDTQRNISTNHRQVCGSACNLAESGAPSNRDSRASRPHLSSLRGQKVIIMLSTSAEN